MSRRERAESELTLTERARRRQLIEATVEQVAEHGYAGTSLARIAERAGITKAAVLYHFPSKDAVVRAAYEHVLTALVAEVAAAVEAAEPARGPAAYIRSMIGHLREHPRHTRMITEAMTNDTAKHESAERWRPLAQILEAAGPDPRTDLRTLAIIISGGIDAIVAEQLGDPAYDTAAAADQLVALVETELPS
ncbi:regulatory protein, tetR family [Saccharopolyspora antimicrobica]|uniref:Regulatory protein, tetR family n=1 Tax=Saccharopolyspora antimicrobica TaxID=455193 RepID=A0A1I4QDL1_9PSEU|nr:TetR/AcrR family transcriptional regulator [Saccharopolyspora antimicrobica]RKT84872.1 TetR family transcriptional regulator [Saccharopolyspora antimicrobica]SFM37713.1 regulatory protein, tetR family [Saccharopolyspora antimicrobica]